MCKEADKIVRTNKKNIIAPVKDKSDFRQSYAHFEQCKFKPDPVSI